MVTCRTVLKLMVLIYALGVSRITATSTTTYSTNTASTSTDSTNTATTASVPTSTTSVPTSTTSVPTSTSQTTSTTAISTGSTNTDTTTTAASTTTTSTTTTTPKIDTKDFKLSLRVNKDVSQTELSNSSSPYYIQLKENCTDALTKKLNETVIGLKSVTVTNLSYGSLIIDFTVVVNTAENPNPQSNFSAVVASIKAGITIGGEPCTIETDVCDLLRPVCTTLSQTCVTDSNNKAYCTAPKSSANDIRLIVGLVVGLPLFASWWTFSY